jgi:hypothetical protein
MSNIRHRQQLDSQRQNKPRSTQQDTFMQHSNLHQTQTHSCNIPIYTKHRHIHATFPFTPNTDTFMQHSHLHQTQTHSCNTKHKYSNTHTQIVGDTTITPYMYVFFRNFITYVIREILELEHIKLTEIKGFIPLPPESVSRGCLGAGCLICCCCSEKPCLLT